MAERPGTDDDRSGRADGLDLSRRGGAGTFRGTDYQLRVAVREALKAIVRQHAAPHRPITIALESLQLADGRSEKWDVAVVPPTVVREAKATPTAADIRTFAARAAASTASEVAFVYGAHAGATQRTLETLMELAAAADDASEYEQMLAATLVATNKLPTEIHGAFDRLRAMTLEHVPEAVLAADIETRAALLAGERGPALASMLFDLFSADASMRRVHRVGDLIGEAARRGIEIRVADNVSAFELPRPAREALLLLQETNARLPIEVVADAVGRGIKDLEEDLRELEASGTVDTSGGIVSLAALPVRLVRPEREAVLERGLAALLSWLDVEAGAAPEELVDVAISLSAALEECCPAVVARVFPVLDKRLKRRGDKRLVFEIAERSISAAVRSPIRDTAVVKAEAHALICGRSWVYQRVGELEKARADGEASLEIGEQIGWDRNTAFCKKCLGRLARLQAERTRGEERAAYLAESVGLLKEAIERFSALRQEAEVGDSYSLLARTYLVAGDLPAAETAAAQASLRLTDPKEKDFLDLEIVRGDIALERGELAEAESRYARVIAAPANDAAVTEMQARAHERFADSLSRRGETSAAIGEYARAGEIFRALKEPERAALSDVEAMVLAGRMPREETEPEVARMLAAEPPLVRVLAVRAHERAIAEREGDTIIAYRDEATPAHWRKMIEIGRRGAARDRRGW